MRNLLITVILLMSSTPSPLHSADKVTVISNRELPSVVVAYGLFCSRYNDFKSLRSYGQNPLVRLSRSIDALPGGISTALAFVHRSYIVQNAENHFSGFMQSNNKSIPDSGIPFEGMLFVTTPIESLGGRVLAIISATSPERTTILAIDNGLNAELLYDSLSKNDIENIKDITGTRTLGSIFNVRVMKPGIFEVDERAAPGGPGTVSHHENRTFVIDTASGTFRLSMKTNGNNRTF